MTNSKLTWKQTIKLGKQEVVRQLGDRGIVFDIKTQYFKLCSLLYKAAKAVKAVVAPVVNLAERRYQKIQERRAKITDPVAYLDSSEEYLDAFADYLISQL